MREEEGGERRREEGEGGENVESECWRGMKRLLARGEKNFPPSTTTYWKIWSWNGHLPRPHLYKCGRGRCLSTTTLLPHY